jgi:hypothetical protein
MPTADEAEKQEANVQAKGKQKYWAPYTSIVPLDTNRSNPYKQ